METDMSSSPSPPSDTSETMLRASNDVLLGCVEQLNKLETQELKLEDISCTKTLDKIVHAVNRSISLRRPLLDLIRLESQTFSDLSSIRTRVVDNADGLMVRSIKKKRRHSSSVAGHKQR